MDFIFANNVDLSSDFNTLRSFRYSDLDDTIVANCTGISQHIVWGRSFNHVNRINADYFFDGQCSSGNNFYHSNFLSEPLDTFVDAISSGKEISNGIFCLLKIEQKGLNRIITLFTDWLGQYPIYIWQHGSKFIVSNNIRMLETACHEARSILPAIENMVTGGASYDCIHLDNVRQLPFGATLTVDAAGSLVIQQPIQSRAVQKLTYEDAFSILKQELMTHVAAIFATMRRNNIDPYIICDLTGGADTRAVLATVLGGIEPCQIHVRTMGQFPNPDVNVAAYIALTLGLSQGHFPVVAAPGDFSVRLNGLLSGGARDAGAMLGPTGFYNLIHFTGHFGEIAGKTPSNNYIEEAFSSGGGIIEAVELYIKRRKTAGAINLLSKDAIDFAKKSLQNQYEELSNEFAPEQLYTERYLRTRCRTHFGLLSFISNKGKILPDILANRWLVEAGRILPAHLRQKNKVIYDLIANSTVPELAFFPMEKKRWDDEIVPKELHKLLHDMNIIDFKSPSLVDTNHNMHTNINIPISLGNQYTSIANIPNNNNRALTPQLANLNRHRAIAHFFLESIDANADVWSMFDRQAIIKELAKPDDQYRTDGIDVNAIGIFCSAMAWKYGLEICVPLRKLDSFDPANKTSNHC